MRWSPEEIEGGAHILKHGIRVRLSIGLPDCVGVREALCGKPLNGVRDPKSGIKSHNFTPIVAPHCI